MIYYTFSAIELPQIMVHWKELFPILWLVTTVLYYFGWEYHRLIPPLSSYSFSFLKWKRLCSSPEKWNCSFYFDSLIHVYWMTVYHWDEFGRRLMVLMMSAPSEALSIMDKKTLLGSFTLHELWSKFFIVSVSTNSFQLEAIVLHFTWEVEPTWRRWTKKWRWGRRRRN